MGKSRWPAGSCDTGSTTGTRLTSIPSAKTRSGRRIGSSGSITPMRDGSSKPVLPHRTTWCQPLNGSPPVAYFLLSFPPSSVNRASIEVACDDATPLARRGRLRGLTHRPAFGSGLHAARLRAPRRIPLAPDRPRQHGWPDHGRRRHPEPVPHVLLRRGDGRHLE